MVCLGIGAESRRIRDRTGSVVHDAPADAMGTHRIPKPTPRPGGRVADVIPWVHANLRTLVILSGLVAAVTLLPWIISWWRGSK